MRATASGRYTFNYAPEEASSVATLETEFAEVCRPRLLAHLRGVRLTSSIFSFLTEGGGGYVVAIDHGRNCPQCRFPLLEVVEMEGGGEEKRKEKPVVLANLLDGFGCHVCRDDVLAKALTKVRDLSKTGTFTAQLGLHESLAQPRLSLTHQAHKLAEIKLHDATLEELAAFRIDRKKRSEGGQQASDVAAVVSLDKLHVGSTKVGSSTQYSGLTALSKKRKAMHDQSVTRFVDFCNTLSDELEERVIKSGHRLQNDLSAMCASLDTEFTELCAPETLVTRDLNFVMHAWTKLAGMCARHARLIDAFIIELDEIEVTRSAKVGHQLTKLIEKLIGVAHMLPAEVERLAEAHANDVNLVTIDNRREHAELNAKLRRSDTYLFAKTRRRWMKDALVAWRLLRHEQAVHNYHATMQSDAYAAPPEEAALFSELEHEQVRRHNTVRLSLLRDDLGAQRPPRLSSSEAEQIRIRAESLSREEQASNEAFFAKLTELRATINARATDLVEDFRAELHEYAALSPEPDLEAHRTTLRGLMYLDASEEELAALEEKHVAPLLTQPTGVNAGPSEFYRRSGNLKKELVAVDEALVRSELIYDEKVASVRARVEAVVCGFEVDHVLEPQGKLGDKRALRNTLEKMRCARRDDVPAIIPTLLKQLQSIASAHGLDVLFVEKLNAMAATLERMAAFAPGRGSGSPTTRGSQKSGRTHNTRASSRGGGHSSTPGSRASTALHTPKVSESRGGFGESDGTPRGGLSTAGGGSIDMGSTFAGHGGDGFAHGGALSIGEARNVQRRLAMLLWSSSLSDALKLELRSMLRSFDMQASANAAVDAVVKVQSRPEVLRLEARGKALVHGTGVLLADQADVLSISCDYVAAFVKQIAKLFEEHAEKNVAIDDASADVLDNLVDAFEENENAREAHYAKNLEKLRHAPNEEKLEEFFDESLGELSGIEAMYRNFHSEGITLSNEHPETVTERQLQFYGDLFKDMRLGAAPTAPPPLPKDVAAEAVAGSASNAAAAAANPNEGAGEAGRVAGGDGASAAEVAAADGESDVEVAAAADAAEAKLRHAFGWLSEGSGALSDVELAEQILDGVFAREAEEAEEKGEEAESAKEGDAARAGAEGDVAEATNASAEGVGGADGADGDASEEGAPAVPALPAEDAASVASEAPSSGGSGGFFSAARDAAGALDDAALAALRDADAVDGAVLAAVGAALRIAGRVGDADANEWTVYQAAIGDAEELISALVQLATSSDAGVAAARATVGEAESDTEGAAAVAAAPLAAVVSAPARALLDAAAAASDAIASSVHSAAALSLLAWSRAMQEGVDGTDGAGGDTEDLSDEQLALDMLSLEDVAPPLPELVVPKSLVAELVHALRESCIRELASKGVQRRGAVHAQCEDRKAKLTEQLEERLRQHWPRKGRIEVKAHQPRGDELRKHQARYLRHVRKVRDILRKQGESLAALEQQAREHSAEYLSAVQVLDARIPRMRKLTALQGVLRKGMQARTDFAHEVEAYRERLEGPAVHEPRALLDDNALFLRGCHTFATGGDYDTGEIQIAQDKLLEVDSEINDAIRVRQKRVAKTVKEQDEAITAFSALETTYQRVKLELSMREGLGHKYGAPRRGVQEQLRTETTKSSAAESAIVENITSLEGICATTLELPSAATALAFLAELAEEALTASPSIVATEAEAAANVIRTMTSIRRQFLEYAVYLEALKEETRVDTMLTAVPWWSDALQRELEHDDTVVADAEAALASASALSAIVDQRRASGAPIGGLSVERSADELAAIEMLESQLSRNSPQFTVVAHEAEEQCRKETQELYTKEGKQDLLGPDGVTEALKEYLQQMQKRGEEHRVGAHRNLRRQIDRMWRILMSVPPAVYRSIALFEQRATVASRRTIRIAFKVKFDALESQKARHHTDLRPQLASASAAAQLAALLGSEATRWDKSKALIRETHTELIGVEVARGRAAEQSILDATSKLLNIMDPIMTRQELRDLPNQSPLQQKRRSLKRLRKAQLKRDRGEVVVGLSQEATAVGRPRRTWPGVPLGLVATELALGGAGDVSGMGAEGDAEAEAAVDSAELAGTAANAAAAVAAVESSEAVESYLTEAHHAVIQCRDETHAACVSQFKANVAAIHSEFAALLATEEQWGRNWAQLAGRLQED